MKPMSAKKFSLYLAGGIWLLVALRIGGRAMQWLEPYFEPPQWQLALIAVSIVLGAAKANTVLKKAVNRNLGNLDKIKEGFLYYICGWLILYNVRGSIVITLMIALGWGLRSLRASGFDAYNLFGFLYLAVAIALAASSTLYFQAAKSLQSR